MQCQLNFRVLNTEFGEPVWSVSAICSMLKFFWTLCFLHCNVNSCQLLRVSCKPNMHFVYTICNLHNNPIGDITVSMYYKEELRKLRRLSYVTKVMWWVSGRTGIRTQFQAFYVALSLSATNKLYVGKFVYQQKISYIWWFQWVSAFFR